MSGTFDENGYAIGTFRIMTYEYNPITKELYGSRIEKIVDGTGLPANATLVEPPEWKQGYTLIFDVDNEQWDYIVDYRGQTVYNIYNGSSMVVDYLGEIKPNYTLQEPPGAGYEFVNDGWRISEDILNQEPDTDDPKEIQLRNLEYQYKDCTDNMRMYDLLGDIDSAREYAKKRLELSKQIETLKEEID